jgi:hypothetical protein
VLPRFWPTFPTGCACHAGERKLVQTVFNSRTGRRGAGRISDCRSSPVQTRISTRLGACQLTRRLHLARIEACPTPQAADPCAIVIFGASGDLTKRKLLLSLYNLGSYHLLPAHFSIIGVTRRPLSDDAFRDQLGKDLAELGKAWRGGEHSTKQSARFVT